MERVKWLVVATFVTLIIGNAVAVVGSVTSHESLIALGVCIAASGAALAVLSLHQK